MGQGLLVFQAQGPGPERPMAQPQSAWLKGARPRLALGPNEPTGSNGPWAQTSLGPNGLCALEQPCAQMDPGPKWAGPNGPGQKGWAQIGQVYRMVLVDNVLSKDTK